MSNDADYEATQRERRARIIASRRRAPAPSVTDAVIDAAIAAHQSETSMLEASDTLPEVVLFYDRRVWQAVAIAVLAASGAKR